MRCPDFRPIAPADALQTLAEDLPAVCIHLKHLLDQPPQLVDA